MLVNLHKLFTKTGKRIDKPKAIRGELWFDEHNGAGLGDAGGKGLVLERLDKARVTTISADGLFIEGFEDVLGGGQKLRYQRWWVIPIVPLVEIGTVELTKGLGEGETRGNHA